MEMVKLKNGSTEPLPLVVAAMMSLERLFQEDAILAYEITEACRKPGHQFFGNSGSRLQALALIGQDGRPPQSVVNIVLSAVTGEMLGLKLGDPIER